MWTWFAIAAAWAAPVTVELPAPERLDVWADALRVAELEPQAGAAARVRLLATPSGWVIEVTRPGATPQRAAVEAPATSAARERITLLAASLLAPVELDALAVVLPPPAAAKPAAAKPAAAKPAAAKPAAAKPAAVKPAAVAPVAAEPVAATTIVVAGQVVVAEQVVDAEQVVEEPLVIAEPALIVAAAPAPVEILDLDPVRREPYRGPAWGSFRTGLCTHPGDDSAAPTVAALAGYTVAPWLRVGAGAVFLAPLTVDLDSGVSAPDRSLLGLGGRGGAWVGDRVRLGAVATVARRTFFEGSSAVASVTVPSVGAEASVRIDLPREGLTLLPVAGLHQDLVPVELYVGDQPAGRLRPTTIELLAEVQIRTRARGLDPDGAPAPRSRVPPREVRSTNVDR